MRTSRKGSLTCTPQGPKPSHFTERWKKYGKNIEEPSKSRRRRRQENTLVGKTMKPPGSSINRRYFPFSHFIFLFVFLHPIVLRSNIVNRFFVFSFSWLLGHYLSVQLPFPLPRDRKLYPRSSETTVRPSFEQHHCESPHDRRGVCITTPGSTWI